MGGLVAQEGGLHVRKKGFLQSTKNHFCPAVPRSSYELPDFVVLMNHSILGEALRQGALKMWIFFIFRRCSVNIVC
jgi:hypothetical protein